MAINLRKSRNLKSNAMPKQISAMIVVANEGLLCIKIFQNFRLEHWIVFDGVYELFYT